MRRRTLILILLGIYYIGITIVNAQDGSTVSDETRQSIQSQLNIIFGSRYLLGIAISIDSLKNQDAAPDRLIEDTFGTLQHCIVFTAVGKNNLPKPYGLVGVFKDNQILWRSDTVISANIVFADEIVTTQDLNKDGKIDIVISWIEPHPYSGYEQWWIVSWDGQVGNFINTYEEGVSTLKSMEGGFQLQDINGDGIKEIIGAWMTNPQDETVIGNMTYSWNGQKYGPWSNPPQPIPGIGIPRDRLTAIVHSIVCRIENVFKYSFLIQNSTESIQQVNNIRLDCKTDTVFNITVRYKWESYFTKNIFIDWSGLFTDPNFIKQGEIDSSFSFYSITIPGIVKCYIRGYNGISSDGNYSTNSFKAFTLGPIDSPAPFIPLNFLDTLSGYTNQSRTLSWIKDSITAVKYLGYFSTAKTKILQNDTATAKSTLRQVISDVDVDSTSHLTSEAYALLRFNTEYLIPRVTLLDTLKIPSQYSTIQSAINVANSGQVILVSAGTYNEQDSINNKSSLKVIAVDTNVTVKSFNISNSNSITVKGFKINASGTSQDGIQLTGTQNSKITIEANEIKNSSKNGITIGQYSDSINIVNNVIANNDQNGISIANGAIGTQFIVNNTIVKNNRTGIEAVGPQKLYIVNNIVIYDTLAGRSGERLVRGSGSTYIMQRNNLVLRRQNGVIQSNYLLVPGSIAIDKGTTSFSPLPIKDKAGSPRVSGTTIDVGAYEYQQ